MGEVVDCRELQRHAEMSIRFDRGSVQYRTEFPVLSTNEIYHIFVIQST